MLCTIPTLPETKWQTNLPSHRNPEYYIQKNSPLKIPLSVSVYKEFKMSCHETICCMKLLERPNFRHQFYFHFYFLLSFAVNSWYSGNRKTLLIFKDNEAKQLWNENCHSLKQETYGKDIQSQLWFCNLILQWRFPDFHFMSITPFCLRNLTECDRESPYSRVKDCKGQIVTLKITKNVWNW